MTWSGRRGTSRLLRMMPRSSSGCSDMCRSIGAVERFCDRHSQAMALDLEPAALRCIECGSNLGRRTNHVAFCHPMRDFCTLMPNTDLAPHMTYWLTGLPGA